MGVVQIIHKSLPRSIRTPIARAINKPFFLFFFYSSSTHIYYLYASIVECGRDLAVNGSYIKSTEGTRRKEGRKMKIRQCIEFVEFVEDDNDTSDDDDENKYIMYSRRIHTTSNSHIVCMCVCRYERGPTLYWRTDCKRAERASHTVFPMCFVGMKCLWESSLCSHRLILF